MSKHHHSLNKKRWALVRQIVFKRDNRLCMICGKPGVLECHHIQKIEDGGAAYDPDNCITYCRFCHLEHHKKPDDVPGRGDWLEFLAEISSKNHP